jgi:tetratricopeptide (TPR) repeat protein
MNRWIILMIAVSLLTLSSITSCSNDNWETHFDAGIKASESGDYDGALEHFKEALSIAKTEGGDGTHLYKSYYQMAQAFYDQEHYPTCDSLLKECIQQLSTPDEKEKDKQLFSVVNLLAISQSYQPEQQDSSEANYKKALGLAGKVWGEKSRKSASVMENLAALHRTHQKYSEAIDLLKISLPIWEGLFGKDSDKLIITLDDLGINYMLADSLKVAEDYFLRSKEIEEKSKIVNSLTVRRLQFLADIYERSGDDTKAADYQNQATMIIEQLKK